MASTDILPQHPITTTQKQYLVNKLMTLKKRKFATDFRSPIDPDDPANTKLVDVVERPMDLSTIASNLLDDNYFSVQAFQDDIQLIGDNAKKRHGSESSVTAASNELLEFVNKFMMKLPGAETVQNIDQVSLPKKRKKRKAIEDAEEEEPPKPKKSKRPDGVTPQLWKEQNCLAKQEEAYRAGTASNVNKKRRNLVSEALKRVTQEKVKKQKEEAEERRQLESFVRINADGERKNDDNEEADAGAAESGRPEQKSSGSQGGSNNPKKDIDGRIILELNDTEQGADPAEDGHDGQLGDEAGSSKENAGMDVRIWDYEDHLQHLPTEFSTQAQINSLKHSASSGPNYLGRTASLSRGWNFGQFHKKSNGFTAQDLLLPSADIRDERYCSHDRLIDLTQGEIIYMVGNHLIWKDLRGDEFLSYSKDPLFLVVHALRRHHEKQGNVTIQFMDRRKAKTSDGDPAAFYVALDLYTTYEVPRWGGWGIDSELHPRKFTQEYVTHGPVLYSDSNIKQARIEDLIRDGLYEIFSQFRCPKNHKRAGLYTLQVVYRKYLDLIRDCIAVFSLTPLPPNYVEIAHPFNDSIVRDFTYSAYDNKQHGPHVKSHLYLPESHARDKKKTTERRNRKKGKGKESSQESASRENSSQELASAGTSAASDSSATSLGEVLEDGSDEEVEADETGDEQILLASTGENEEIATFSRNDEAAKSAADSAFVRAKPGKGQL